MKTRSIALRIAALGAVAFGLATLASGGRALFGGADMGAIVPFVLWFNFLAGFFYILAGAGLWRGAAWATKLALAIAAATAAVFAFFLLHVWQGGAYETRTLAAMSLRLAVWLAISFVARRSA